MRNEFWTCPVCLAQNHEIDAECQFCDEHEHIVKGTDFNENDPDPACSECGARGWLPLLP